MMYFKDWNAELKAGNDKFLCESSFFLGLEGGMSHVCVSSYSLHHKSLS